MTINYISLAFQINEKRKVFTLLNSIRNIASKRIWWYPTESLTREASFSKNDWQLMMNSIFHEKSKKISNEDKIRIWENERFNTYKLYEDLITTFEKEYPDYYRLKYNANILSVKQIQHSINPNQLLVEYALSDTIIFIYTISRNS